MENYININGKKIKLSEETIKEFIYYLVKRKVKGGINMDNYFMINGKKIEISEETATNMEKQFKENDAPWWSKEGCELLNPGKDKFGKSCDLEVDESEVLDTWFEDVYADHYECVFVKSGGFRWLVRRRIN